MFFKITYGKAGPCMPPEEIKENLIVSDETNWVAYRRWEKVRSAR
jgi:hypothetical protein